MWGCAMTRAARFWLAHLLTTDQCNEIAVELLKGLEVGEYQFSKYIPEYLGEFALWLPPEQLDDLIERLHILLANGNERIVSVALDTLGVLLECYSRYPGRFEEPRETAEDPSSGLDLKLSRQLQGAGAPGGDAGDRPACIRLGDHGGAG